MSAMLTAALLAAAPAGAVNLLFNPHFDSGLSGWTLSPGPLGFAAWDATRDAAGSHTSGSVRTVEQSAVASDDYIPISQCVENVVPGAVYSYSVQMMAPSGQARTGYGNVGILFYEGAGCQGSVLSGNLSSGATDATPNAWVSVDGGGNTAPPGARSLWLYLEPAKNEAGGTYEVYYDDAVVDGPACVAGSSVLCVDDQVGDARWDVRVHYHTSQGGGRIGDGHAIPLAPLGVGRGGLFWFFDAANPELLIKVLNGCAVNGKYWVFDSAGTNVGFDVTVKDTRTGLSRTYSNADLHAAAPVQDTGAFACPQAAARAGASAAPAPEEPLGAVVERAPAKRGTEEPLALAGTCTPDATTLCVANRFKVQVSYQTSQGGGRSGSGQAIGLASVGVTEGGLFWFFGADNPEMLVKVLNGCGVNNHFWVFYSAGTNVGFTVTVTDEVTGHLKTYRNTDLVAAPPVQDTLALACP